MKQKTPILDIILFAAGIALLAVCAGCATKSRHLDISGMYANQSGSVAIGSIEVQSAPEGVESAMVSYEDSAAWFSETKEHRIRILLTGTNSVTAADAVVSNICAAFIATAPAIVSPSTSLSPARTSAETSTPTGSDSSTEKGSATGTAGEL